MYLKISNHRDTENTGAAQRKFQTLKTQIASNLKHESETKAHLAWYLSRERLIESRISGDTTVSQAGQDLTCQSSTEHGPESIQLTKPVSITDPKISRRQRIGRNLAKETQHIVLVECVEQIHVKLQRVSPFTTQLDRMCHLEIRLRVRRRPAQVSTRRQEGIRAVELYASRHRCSTQTDERGAKLSTVRTRAIQAVSEKVFPVERVRTKCLKRVRTIGRQQAIVRIAVRVKAEERQIEEPVDVWTRATDTKSVGLIGARQTGVVASQPAVRVTDVEEIVIGEPLVESQLHRVVETFRER